MEPVSGSLFAAPAAPPRRRRWGRFSLRTLLIAVTLASFAMALFSRYERTRRAVAAIEASGGGIFFVQPEEEPGPIESWLRARLPQSYFDDVWRVDFCCHNEATGCLAQLSRLTSLRELDLSRTHVSDAEMAHLSGLTSLQVIFLNGTRVSDAGLAHLSGHMSLQVLFLNGTHVTDAGVQELRRSLPNCSINR